MIRVVLGKDLTSVLPALHSTCPRSINDSPAVLRGQLRSVPPFFCAITMTDKEAEKEARRRWRHSGVVRRRRAREIALGLKPYAVGKGDDSMFQALGEGETWEEAFADADEVRS